MPKLSEIFFSSFCFTVEINFFFDVNGMKILSCIEFGSVYVCIVNLYQLCLWHAIRQLLLDWNRCRDSSHFFFNWSQFYRINSSDRRSTMRYELFVCRFFFSSLLVFIAWRVMKAERKSCHKRVAWKLWWNAFKCQVHSM